MAGTKAKADNDFFHIHRQGFLLKEPPRGMRKRLVRYWFVLFESREQLAFLFFHNEDHFLERKKNEGFFRIDDATSINVLPEHLGRKNAFSICTPRNAYKIVSESRYELHQWLVVLNETMEKFTKRREEEKERKARRRSVRQRAQSVSADAVSTSTSASTYPRRKPTRKAPPVPKTKGEGEGGSPENQQNTESHTETAAEEDASNLEDLMANLMASTQELQAAMEYSMTEEEPHSVTESPEPPVTPPTPTSPSAVASATATPVPNSQETTTPDSMVNGVNNKKDELTRSIDDLSERSSIQVTTNTGSGKRKSTKKRVGSMKGMRRSVSPPNVPPPPPPSFDERRTPPTDATDGSPPQPVSQQKYLKMMDSFNDIGDELNQIASELNVKENGAAKAKPPTPARVSSLSAEKPPSKPSSEVGDYLDEAFERQDINEALEGERSESMEVLVDAPSAANGKTDSSPGILRRGKERTGERGQVTFQDSSQAYEPRIDQEAVPTSVADAKLKLFGEKDATRFSKTMMHHHQNQALNTNNNNGDQTASESTTSLPAMSNAEDLLHSIESALQTTSYMEHQKLTEEAEENAYESPWDNTAIARYGLPGSDRGGVSFSADLGRKGRSLERKRRSAGSPQHAVKSPDLVPASSRSVENILGRSSTFSSGSYSLSRPSNRSVSMASDLERQQLQQWLRNSQGKKFPPPTAPKKTQTNYNTLPNWSQLKSSGTQVSYNSSMQSTVYRSLV